MTYPRAILRTSSFTETRGSGGRAVFWYMTYCMKDFDDMGHGKPAAVGKIGRVGGGVKLLGRQALALIGLALVVLSIPIGFLTPFLPIGLPIGIFGSALLARNSVWGQRLIGYIVNRFPALEKIAPNWLVKLVLGREKRSSEN